MSGDSGTAARDERGFTLVEVAVATLLFLLVLLVTNGLLVESLRIFSLAGRELRQPNELLALRQLREDLHAALPPGPPDPIATSQPLVARQADAIAVWQLVDERLERRLWSLDGTDLGARPMLDGMISCRWRVIAPGLTQVDLVRRRPRPGRALGATTSAWRPHGQSLELATVLAGSRLEPEP